MTRVLWITGAGGFLGRHLLKLAASDPEFDVIALVRRAPEQTIKGVRYLNVEKENDSLWNSQPRTVVNAATHYGRGPRAAQETLESNLMFPIRILEKAGPFIEHFITLDTYYNKFERPYAYLPEYCRSKRNLLEWLLARTDKLRVTRVFLEHVYGPGDRDDKFIPNVLSSLAQNIPLDLTSGLQTRDFIYVEDASSALIEIARALRGEAPGYSEFEVGTGNPVSIRSIAELARSILNSSSELRFGALPNRQDEIPQSYADISPLIALGWEPRVSLREGLDRTIREMFPTQI